MTKNLIFAENGHKLDYDHPSNSITICLHLSNEPNGSFQLNNMFENEVRQMEA